MKHSVKISNMRHFLFMLTAMLCLTACNKIEEEIPPLPESGNNNTEGNGSYSDSIANISTVTLLQKHTTGNGFHVIIMADGYTKEDISNNTYRKAVMKAQAALFEQEPMTSLRDYIDLIEVAVPSKESGVSETRHDTALRTYFPDNTSNVYGDSITIQTCALKALVQVYNIQTTEELLSKFNNTLIITLLNSGTYKGVTLLTYDEAATDRIPAGFSLSYIPVIPVKPFGNINIDIMPYLIRHEAVGHGIGKLADEYCYTGNTPTSQDKYLIEDGLKYGLYMNTKYDDNANRTNAVSPIEQTSWIYEIQQHPAYSALDIQWYTGAFEFPIKFCRCSNYSTMNETYKPGDPNNNPNNNTFNTPSRAMIYKRIMRAADPNYVWNLDEFIEFDAAGRNAEAIQTVVAYTKATTPRAHTVTATEKPLVSPKIIKPELSKIHFPAQQ